MKKILCPIDFSETSLNGLYYAYELSKYFNAELIFFHSLSEGPDDDAATLLDKEENAKEELQRLCCSLPKQRNQLDINYHFLVRRGNTIENILDILSEKKIDVVIMGTKGIEDKQSEFGSISAEVVAKSFCPVIIVPDKINFKTVTQLVYATDLKGEENSLFHFVNSFAKSSNAHICYVTVDTNSSKINEVSENENYLIKYIKKNNSSFHKIQGEDVLEAINGFADTKNADLIIMSTSERSPLKDTSLSHTRQMVFRTTTPLLVMHKRIEADVVI